MLWVRAIRIRIQAWMICAGLWLLWLTWRIDDEEIEKIDTVIERGASVVACFWHGSYVPLFILIRNHGATVFTSESLRGAVIVQICRHFGYRAVLIPETGEEAYERMLRAVPLEQIVALAVDGPLGPYHVVKRGPVRLASEAGVPILTVSVAASRARVARGRWDRQKIPAPFSRVALAVSDPIEIPSHLSDDEIEDWRKQIAGYLAESDRRAEIRLNG